MGEDISPPLSNAAAAAGELNSEDLSIGFTGIAKAMLTIIVEKRATGERYFFMVMQSCQEYEPFQDYFSNDFAFAYHPSAQIPKRFIGQTKMLLVDKPIIFVESRR